MNEGEKSAPAGRWLDRPWRLPVLLAGALLAASLFQGSRGLYETTEGRYAECAREMARRGNWLEPVLNGLPHWTKPPLTYVAIGLPCRVLGPTTVSARLYLIPCYLVVIGAVWWMALRMWRDRGAAGLSAMVYATAGIPMIASQTTSTDFPLAASLALAQACFWEAFRSRSKAAAYGVGLFMGVAFLTKGPPALLIVPAFILTWLRLPRPARRTVPLFSPVTLALFLAVGFGWYAWESWRHPGLMSYWLKDEVVNRSLSHKFNRNPEFYKGFLIYLPVLILGSLPWSGWLAFRWREVWARVRVPGGVRGVLTGLSDEGLWLAWSVAFPLAVFMLSESKLPYYVLPLFAPLAVAMGRLLTAAYQKDVWFRRAASLTWAVALAVFVLGKGIYAHYPSERDMGQLHRVLSERYGLRDGGQFSILGVKHLNGLSYYYDRELALVPAERLAAWADEGGERLLLCGHHRVAEVRAQLAGHRVEELDVTPKWRLLKVAAGYDAKAP